MYDEVLQTWLIMLVNMLFGGTEFTPAAIKFVILLWLLTRIV